MKKLISIATLIILVAVIFTGCTSEEPQNTKEPIQDQTNEEISLPTVDRAGNEIKVPEEINKIITMAPSIAETLIAL
ncbi:MAG: ABC transporter substrate-binding protein, partial [Tissierellia bacterium]|nr:ABC transporter substrate-binding protein [Tissierellia bacterium]